ncbi:ABC transporter substrate-binding protein [Agrobacterium tumefaciens]|uniref:ABC transporter substrate-binding protein n=1 Tax=Agrobacterium tumefaciens TaxID=358 RepID=UPI00157324BA|nr:ABC transporter substrate-binding protein [Agrobacterium tumefaciens]NTE68061.1 ABC transporter substrate-binding protein [Agrobacterium tumefaciens]
MFKRSLLSLCLFAALLTGKAHAVSLEVLSLPLSTPPQLIDAFKTEHPEIELKLRPPAVDYDDLTQRLIRDGISRTMPDVIFQGYNRSALTVRRGLAAPLSPFLEADKNWVQESYKATSDDLCRHDGKIYGLPFIISVPVLYYNADLVRQAGGNPDQLPQTWEDITALAARISALGDHRTGSFFDYAAAGNWTFMALINAQGGKIMSADDSKIAFDGPAGMRTLSVLQMFGKAGQVDMPRDQAYQAFSAGTVGVLLTSSGFLKSLLKQAKFEVRTAAIPIAEDGWLPAGGNCMMMTAMDPARQKAAWTFMKFMADAKAQQLMFDTTGYIPGNRLGVGGLEKTVGPNDPRMTSVRSSTKAGEWYSFPGDNSLRITEVVRSYLQQVVTLRRTPQEAMTLMVNDIQHLLPR